MIKILDLEHLKILRVTNSERSVTEAISYVKEHKMLSPHKALIIASGVALTSKIMEDPKHPLICILNDCILSDEKLIAWGKKKFPAYDDDTDPLVFDVTYDGSIPTVIPTTGIGRYGDMGPYVDMLDRYSELHRDVKDTVQVLAHETRVSVLTSREELIEGYVLECRRTLLEEIINKEEFWDSEVIKVSPMEFIIRQRFKAVRQLKK